MTMQAILINPNQLAPKVEAALRKLKRNNKDVVSVAYNFENDWSGDPAIYFRIVLSDEAAREDKLMEVTQRLENKIIGELGFYSTWPILPYFSYRSESEYLEVGNRGWR
jgi:hypothetical protein